MNFEKLAEMLEEHAEQMGVLIVNIDTEEYKRYLDEGLYKKNPKDQSVCALDARTVYLEGLDAGIILEQSQAEHSGPLASQLGRQTPIMALPNLDKQLDEGSMLAWVCWDEFVNLHNPYSVRWMEKCNEPHIAAVSSSCTVVFSNTLLTIIVLVANYHERHTGQCR